MFGNDKSKPRADKIKDIINYAIEHPEWEFIDIDKETKDKIDRIAENFYKNDKPEK